MLETVWKKELTDLLKKLGLIPKDFTGKLVLNISQGTVCDAEKTERLK